MSAGAQEKAESATANLTVGAVKIALKEALSGKYTEDHINKALQELGLPQDGVFDVKKVLEKAPLAMSDLKEPTQDDMMDVNWAEFFGKLGLPMSEDEAKKVMSAAKVSFKTKAKTEKPPDTTSLESITEPQEAVRDGSAMDLLAAKEAEEKELLKIIEELKVESDDISSGLPLDTPTKQPKE